MIGATRTTHGNFLCDFCTKRKMYKTDSGMYNHLEREHKAAVDLIGKDNQIQRLNQQIIELKKAKPPLPEKEYYDATVFCTHCKKLSGCSMPKGIATDHVTCPNCGVCALHLVSNVAYWWAKV